MDVESFGERSGAIDEIDKAPDRPATGRRGSGPWKWLRNTNHNPGVVDFVRRARRALPGDPEFGDPLSAAGVGGPSAAARAADRLLQRDVASREVSLAGLQVWQAITERVSGKPANREVTLVFTDLVGFSAWALKAGDDATLTLLRRVAQAVEPPLLEAGGHIVKRMGDGTMAVFADPAVAVRAVRTSLDAVREIELDGYTPRMRAGVHTGRPQRIGSDWLGVDVNIAARVMERATRGGLVVSQATMERIPDEEFDALGLSAKRIRKQVFSPKQDGVPADLAMYRVKTRRELPGEDDEHGDSADA
jgi:class 3 adenylate cyclase